MKLLTTAETRNWLQPSGLSLRERPAITIETSTPDAARLLVDAPKASTALISFAGRILQWMPTDYERLLLISDWETYPAAGFALLHRIRWGSGDPRTLIDAPAHVFDAFHGDNDAFYRDEETGLLIGLIFLVLSFDFGGFLCARETRDSVYLGDEFAIFSSVHEARLKEVGEIAKTQGLRTSADLVPGWRGK